MNPIESGQEPESPAIAPTAPRPVAPVWHTAILLAAIVLLSVAGAHELTGKDAAPSNRLFTYASTMISELLMFGWVYVGLRIRKIPFRSLFGDLSGGIRTVFLDLGIALLFWIGSMMVLASIGITWTVTEMALKHQSIITHGKPLPPDPEQQKVLHTLSALAPANGREIAAWALVCVMAGLIEETVFRGYLQRQFTAWWRGAVAGGVVFSALMFGAAHGYQGVRNMVLLTIFGVFFSLLAVFRRNLRAGIFAHAWHDFFVGLLLALAKWKHVI